MPRKGLRKAVIAFEVGKALILVTVPWFLLLVAKMAFFTLPCVVGKHYQESPQYKAVQSSTSLVLSHRDLVFTLLKNAVLFLVCNDFNTRSF